MKSKELLLKHLALNDCEGYITSDGRLYKAIVGALNEAINYTHSCTELVCVDDGDLPNLTQDNIYKMIVESNKHYNIIDDNGNDVLISKKYLTKTT